MTDVIAPIYMYLYSKQMCPLHCDTMYHHNYNKLLSRMQAHYPLICWAVQAY